MRESLSDARPSTRERHSCSMSRKTGQAHQAAFRGRPGHRLLRLEIIRQAIPSASVTLQNLDCTTKGGQFDLGVPFIHGAKEALSIFRRGVMTTMRIRL